MPRSTCAGGQWGGCGRAFHSVSSFDKHRTGEYATRGKSGKATRRCMSEAEMVAAGFVVTTAKNGPVWGVGVMGDRVDRFRRVAARGEGQNGQSSYGVSPTETEGAA